MFMLLQSYKFMCVEPGAERCTSTAHSLDGGAAPHVSMPLEQRALKKGTRVYCLSLRKVK